MSSFLFKNRPKFTFSLPPELPEADFQESQRQEALEVLAHFFENWHTSWATTKFSLNLPLLSDSAKNSLTLYETDQEASVVRLLATVFAAWVSDNSPEFSKSIVLLARELRPSLPYVEFDPEEDFLLSPAQLSLLRQFIESTGEKLKETVATLERLSQEKFSFNSSAPLSPEKAELLLRERLRLSAFGDFLDFSVEPDFHESHSRHKKSGAPAGSFPALLAASAEFDLN
ncbi:hypothetical protein IJI72_01175 [Candidatus Saccharibacteria bacterium]|nr:hypothetical protein [Candidatus Saccharibacteria bacterium]